MKGLENDDLVVMHTCGEADFDKNKGHIFRVVGESWDLCGSEMVTIDRLNGDRAYTSFCTEFLQLVAVPQV